jgi:pimeloyl-ACP methyl ester carboxylesterase
MNEAFLTINGLRLRYLEWGDAAAPPILLLHGFSSTAVAWHNVGEALAGRHHVVALDQRGHGSSDWDPQGAYTIDDFVADAHVLSQQLQLAPFVLVGHSMGGSIANTYAGIYPEDVNRLVIQDSAPRPADDPRPPMQPMQAPVFASRDDVVASVREANPHMAQPAVEQRVDVYYVQRQDSTWGFRADVAGVRTALASRPGYEALWQHVRNITMPYASDPRRAGAGQHLREDGRATEGSQPAHRGGDCPGCRAQHPLRSLRRVHAAFESVPRCTSSRGRTFIESCRGRVRRRLDAGPDELWLARRDRSAPTAGTTTCASPAGDSACPAYGGHAGGPHSDECVAGRRWAGGIRVLRTSTAPEIACRRRSW